MKTYKIETIYAPSDRRAQRVELVRYGMVIDSVQVATAGDHTIGAWELRRRGAKLGGTHVMILGKRAPI